MTSVKFVLVLFLSVKTVTTSCVSQNAVNTLNAAKTPLTNIEKYIGKCDRDNALKEPMVSIGRCVKKLQEEFEIVNHIFHKRKWTKYNGHCYFIDHTTRKFKDAVKQCKVFNGVIAKIDSKKENSFIQKLVARSGDHHWIGLTSKINAFYWVHDGKKPIFVNFAGGYPVKSSATPNCVTIHPNGHWYNLVCSSKYKVICESDDCF